MYSDRCYCHILIKLKFSRQIFTKIFKYEIFMKIRPMGAELFHAYGRTDMTKLSAILQTSQENLQLFLKPTPVTRCPISSTVLCTVPYDFRIILGPVMNERGF